jgi:PAS domain S-box-containing protein
MKLEIIIPAIGLMAGLAMATATVRRIRSVGAASVLSLSLAIVVLSIVYWVAQSTTSSASNALFKAIILFGFTLAASAQLTFALWYTNRPEWFTRSVLILLTAVPLLTQALYWTESLRGELFSGEAVFASDPAFTGWWGSFIAIYIYDLLGASLLLLIDRFIRKPRSLLFHSWTILAGAFAPFAIFTLAMMRLDPIVQYRPLLLAFTLSALGFTYGLFGRRLIEVVPVTREAVVEGMDDGWIVLDTKNVIVDINPAAEKIISLTRDKVYGQPILSVLGDLPNLGQNFGVNREYEMKRSVKSQEGWRYLNIRISALVDHHKKNFGRLIIWRDITDRKLAEDARQRARDEMFVLLNAISSAASNSINLDEFLSESIYHIVYPFRSQIVGIFLVEDREQENEESRLFLASHVGLSAEAADDMNYMSPSAPLFEWVARNRQYLLIEDSVNDPRLPAALREMAFSCFLSIPLITQSGEKSKVLGFICLARKEKPVFSQDEIIRLSTISDHIATLIDSDRRRKLAIVLSEREKLMRDLHDSVSQKLYGLVTLTEAAQAGLEAGSTIDPSQFLTRIGENARQAVKEMRLFLYQMQSIDVEKDGLISVLHHRLAAVEGRADMKARLLADEDISLSKDKEIALYYIAQEALNNILRHARAKTVSVTLKQGRQNVILEIVDDGRGFDPKKVDGGGLGLRNMKERAMQVDGKLKIHSSPEKGTKIVVNVRKDQSAKPMRRKK